MFIAVVEDVAVVVFVLCAMEKVGIKTFMMAKYMIVLLVEEADAVVYVMEKAIAINSQ